MADTLATYPYVIVRMACSECSRQRQYRLARLAAKYGADIEMRDLLEYLAGDCKWWRPRHPYHKGCRFAARCAINAVEEDELKALSMNWPWQLPPRVMTNEIDNPVERAVTRVLKEIVGEKRDIDSSDSLLRDLKISSDDLSMYFVPQVERRLGIKVQLKEWSSVITVADACRVLQKALGNRTI